MGSRKNFKIPLNTVILAEGTSYGCVSFRIQSDLLLFAHHGQNTYTSHNSGLKLVHWTQTTMMCHISVFGDKTSVQMYRLTGDDSSVERVLNNVHFEGRFSALVIMTS